MGSAGGAGNAEGGRTAAAVSVNDESSKSQEVGERRLAFVYLGAIGSLHLVWDIADTLNGLMAIPNFVSVLISIPLVRRLQREFFEREADAGFCAGSRSGAG